MELRIKDNAGDNFADTLSIENLYVVIVLHDVNKMPGLKSSAIKLCPVVLSRIDLFIGLSL